jgi:eukaryotic-like serine/threonine-protein kinase
MPETLPRAIGRYEIRRELGRGMMGVVYEAHDPALGRTIALKTIRLAFAVSEEERKAFEERFLTEARVAARLSHPGIVVVHDVGQDGETGTLYIALEHLKGRTLAEVVPEGKPMEWQEAAHISRRVAEALQQAHSQGVIHRDIKPANIMVLPSGEPKIMDFGIAKVEAGHLTATGQFFGTPLYMSPEQALGRPLDARSDLFALAILTYGMLTGQQPFGGSSLPRIITRVLHEDPPPPTLLVPTLPADLDYIIARGLSKDPADRYSDGKTMAEDLDDVLTGRPPRHQLSWVAPARMDGTQISPAAVGEPDRERRPTASTSAASPDVESELASLVAEPPRPPIRPWERPPLRASIAAAAASRGPSSRRTRVPPPARRARPRIAAALGIAALLAGAAGGTFMALGGRSGRASEPTSRPATMEPMTEPADAIPEVTAPAADPPPEALQEARPQAASAQSPEPIPSATPSQARRSVAAPIASRPAPVEPVPSAHDVAPPDVTASAEQRSHLAVRFEHSLQQGTLRVWLDDALIVETVLDSRVTRKLASLELRKGHVEQTLPLAPGTHQVRVQVAWDQSVKTEYISGHFSPGSTRRLSAKLGGGVGGFVRKNLKLEWE